MTCSVSRLIRKTELKKCSRISLLVVLVTCKYAPSLLEFLFLTVSHGVHGLLCSFLFFVKISSV